MHGSTPIRSISLIVKTFASMPLQQLSARRRRASGRRRARACPARPPAAASRRAGTSRPASPSAAASTIPCTLPLGEVSGVLRSPCASIQTTPPVPCTFAIPTSEPSATEWSPPSTSGSAPRSAAAATSSDSRSQRSRIWREVARVLVSHVGRLHDRRDDVADVVDAARRACPKAADGGPRSGSRTGPCRRRAAPRRGRAWRR